MDQLIEELKEKVSAKTQRLSRQRKKQNQYYQNKLFRKECKKFKTVLDRHTPESIMHQVESKWRTSGEKYI